jgi:uncharacterized OB-fold protein
VKISPSQNWRLKDSLYRLALTRCKRCGNVSYPYQPICNNCGSLDVEKIYSKGYGTLIEYTISYQVREGFEKQQPLVVGLIKLDEGAIIVAPIADADGDIKEGARVKAVLRKIRSDSSNGLIQYGIKFKVINNDSNG